MLIQTIKGILIPFIGTILGVTCVLFMKNSLNCLVQKILTGFAAGVMTAASVWSLIIPSIEQSADMGKFSFIPAVVGFLIGISFLLVCDHIAPHFNICTVEAEGSKSNFRKTLMLVFAVTIHNIPEGMAVGAIYAGLISGKASITVASALALSIGIAIQNVPEGAITSMPLKAVGIKKSKAFIYGVLSGIVEPIGAVLTILAVGMISPILPYLLSFAAGAMIFVVISELVPEISEGPNKDIGKIMFAVGFSVMMILDVALG